MADDRKITIEIVDGPGGSKQENEELETNDENEDFKKAISQSLHPIKFLKEKYHDTKLGKNVIFNMAVNKSIETGKSVVNDTFRRYVNLKEDYMAENSYNAISTTISKASSFGSSVVSGIQIGSTMGPIGALVGGSIGAVFGAVNIAQSERMRYSSYYQQLNSSNFQTSFSQTRAGLINNGRGTEN